MARQISRVLTAVLRREHAGGVGGHVEDLRRPPPPIPPPPPAADGSSIADLKKPLGPARVRGPGWPQRRVASTRVP